MSVNDQLMLLLNETKEFNFLSINITKSNSGCNMTAWITNNADKKKYKKWKCDIVICWQCAICSKYLNRSPCQVTLTSTSPSGTFSDYSHEASFCHCRAGWKFALSLFLHDETVPEPKYEDMKMRFTDEDEAKKLCADLKIRFEDSDEPIFANRNFLSMYSTVFRAMFEGDFKKKNAEEIKLGMNREDFLTFLDSLYYPPVPVTTRSFKTIVTIADCYNFPHVLESCKKLAEMRTKDLAATAEECMDYIEAAESYNWDDIMSNIINLVKKNDASFLSELLDGDWIEERNPNTRRALFAELKGKVASLTK